MTPISGVDHGPRVLAFLHDNAAFGGMETLQVEILRNLDRSRYAPMVVSAAPMDWESSRRFRERLRELDVPLLSPVTITGKHATGVRVVWSLTHLLRSERVDVVHIQTRTPLASRGLTLAAELARVPAIVRTEHVSPGPHTTRWTRFAVRPFDWMTDMIVVDSNGDRAEQIDSVGRRADHVVTSYCGIDPFRFDPNHSVADAKRAVGLDPACIVVGTVGRLHEQKGHSFLVAAAARVLARRSEPIMFLIVGDGPDEDALRNQAECCGIADRIQFVGYQAEPLRYMQAMDIVVMPSLWEGFSISMQEFMALGKAMVVSDHHSFREAIVDGEHGLIVPTADAEALAGGIEQLLDDPLQRERFGVAAVDRARSEFSIQRHTDELMDLYDRLLSGARSEFHRAEPAALVS